jgi:flagella basal body P-ring formation protein FlgA
MIILVFLLGFCFSNSVVAFDKKVGGVGIDQGHQPIADAEFQKIFVDFLSRHLNKERQDIAVSKLKVVGNKPVPLGKLSYQLFQKDKRKLKGYVRLTALVYVNGVVKNKVKLFGWVDVFDSVVCVARNLKRGETIIKEDVYLARKNISHINQNVITDTSKIVGLTIKHNVRAETCLKEWMVEKSPIVKRGDVVTILAESTGFRVTVPGKVLLKGYLGELVKIQNLMSKKTIYAKVINSSTVKVDY